MSPSYRAGRLGEEIKHVIGNLILSGLKDPRLQDKMVSISDVDVSSDGSYATVYLTILGKNISEEADETEKKEILQAMKSASGFLRKEIGRHVKVRHVPELSFKIDNSLEYGRHMSQLIDSLDIPHDEATSATDTDIDNDTDA